MGKQRNYQQSGIKEARREQLERAGIPQAKIDKLLNGESVRFDD
jgi:hypothetical protein